MSPPDQLVFFCSSLFHSWKCAPDDPSMFTNPVFLETWTHLMEIIKAWHEVTPEHRGKYPLEGNVPILGVQDLKTFKNLVKVWSDNVPVNDDPKAMKELRDHRVRLAYARCSNPQVKITSIFII